MHRRTFLNLGVNGIGAVLAAGAFAGTGPAVEPDSAPAATAARYANQRQYLATAFGDIAYVEAGRGPAALFLHGFPLNGYQWRDAIAGLAPYRRCLVPDFLGLGHTRVGKDVSLAPDNQVAMLVAFLDQLGIDQVDVVGNDSGGAVAQLLYLRHPQRVRSVLLTNCDTEIECPPKAMEPVIALAGQDRYAQEWLLPWWQDPAKARTPDGFGGMCYRDLIHPTNDAVASYFTPLVATAALRQRTNQFALALAHNSLAGIGDALKASRIPVAIAWGMADTIFSHAGLQYLIDHVGNLRHVHRLDGYKLFWPEERPDVIVREALRLWTSA